MDLNRLVEVEDGLFPMRVQVFRTGWQHDGVTMLPLLTVSIRLRRTGTRCSGRDRECAIKVADECVNEVRPRRENLERGREG